MNSVLEWIISNKTELAGTIFGLVYVWLSIRQSLYTWPAGILTSLFYCTVFFYAKFYAGMGLQVYYLIISMYGWWSWGHSENAGSEKIILKVSLTRNLEWIRLGGVSIALNVIIWFLLDKYTDSPVPFWDSFTTTWSIIATWMLARKKLEHWLIWIFVDLISAAVYFCRGLYPTVILFFVYTAMAIIGFFEWQKEIEKINVNE